MKTLLGLFAFAFLSVALSSAKPGEGVNPNDFPNKITLSLGDKGVLQCKAGEGGKLTELALVAKGKGKAAEPGIDVDFHQEQGFILLNLKNNFKKGLYYRAAIRLRGRQNFVETSLLIPVEAGLISFESWQDPIEELMLFDFKLLEK